MRTARIVEEGAAYYHVMSRVVDRRRVFSSNWEREGFRKIMRAVEAFCGVQILTYCILSNHFHILAYVPERQYVTDCEFIRRLGLLYSNKAFIETMAAHLAKLRALNQDEAAEAVKEEYVYRMYDLGEFMKTLKQRVSIFYNRQHKRKGTLWEERYKSVLVEGKSGALSAMGAYIDLNPVRAGIVKDPKDYRFSGYGEAMGGSAQARAGLGVALGEPGAWEDVSGRYRQLLFTSGKARGVTPEGRPIRAGFAEEVVDGVMAAKGKLPLNEILRCRIRYFTDGAILGSRLFVEEAFKRHRHHFSAKREDGARPMKGAEWGDLFSARQLRVEAIGTPAPA